MLLTRKGRKMWKGKEPADFFHQNLIMQRIRSWCGGLKNPMDCSDGDAFESISMNLDALLMANHERMKNYMNLHKYGFGVYRTAQLSSSSGRVRVHAILGIWGRGWLLVSPAAHASCKALRLIAQISKHTAAC